MLIFVHAVASPVEAQRLKAAGADAIGVLLGDRPNGRVVDEALAHEISTAAPGTLICLEALAHEAVSPALAHRLSARWVQVAWPAETPAEWRERLAAAGLGWVLARVPADEDDDPEWIRQRWMSPGAPPPDWVQVEIFPNIVDGWGLLLESSSEEVDAADLDAMAKERPVVFSLPLTVERASAATKLLPHAHGFALTLSGLYGEVPGGCTFEFEEALQIVAALNACRST